jgi:pyridoxine 5-phosphate synthase
MSSTRLGVNIDHVATLRQARQAHDPDPVAAASVAIRAGADGITVHLRSDRRHIQDRDLELLRQTVRTHLNLEMAATEEMLRVALRVKPDAVCLVPERPDEVTTQGGLDLVKVGTRTAPVVKKLSAAGIKVTFFVEADTAQIKQANKLGARAVEINTDAYSKSKGSPSTEFTPMKEGLRVKRRITELENIARAAKLASSLGLEVHAGHGLDYHNVMEIAAIPEVAELNIGHAIIARAVLDGLDRAVRDMKALLVP